MACPTNRVVFMPVCLFKSSTRLEALSLKLLKTSIFDLGFSLINSFTIFNNSFSFEYSNLSLFFDKYNTISLNSSEL